MPSFEGQFKNKEYLSAQTPWRVLILTFTVFIFTVLIYFGMVFGYGPYLKSKTRSLDQKISVLNQSVDETQQKQIITFFSQMTNIQSLLSKHKTFSQVFDFIERSTYPQINYSDFKFSAAEMEIKIEGTAPSYNDLIKELALYKQSPEVKTTQLENSSAQEQSKEVRFSVKLILDPQFIKQQIIRTGEPTINEATSTPQ
ncbi:MAG: hypothetical protein AAB504_02160 [Patescibacteria group bacterium]